MSDIKQDIEEIKKRLDKLESRMSFLFRRLNIAAEEVPKWNASPAVIDLVERGDKVAAIRAFMDESGSSLKDAKNFIESLIV
jgi:antitoxin component HigA of HigAB toxin-antitoxin module